MNLCIVSLDLHTTSNTCLKKAFVRCVCVCVWIGIRNHGKSVHIFVKPSLNMVTATFIALFCILYTLQKQLLTKFACVVPCFFVSQDYMKKNLKLDIACKRGIFLLYHGPITKLDRL